VAGADDGRPTVSEPSGFTESEPSRSNLTWTVVRGERVRVHPTSEELAEEVHRQFFKVGMAYTALTRRDISAATWIHAARRVAHTLGRPIHTTQDGPEVRAWLKDWPRDDREAEIDRHRRARHAAMRYGIKPDHVTQPDQLQQPDEQRRTVRNIVIAGAAPDEQTILDVIYALERVPTQPFRVAHARYQHSTAEPVVFERDLAALRTADTFVLVLPAGAAAYLEAGIAYALGTPCYLLGTPDTSAPAHPAFIATCLTIDDLIHHLTPG
jgi:hypothetical protein